MAFLDAYFLQGAPLAGSASGSYVPSLVLLSYIIACFGSYTGLKLGSYIRLTTSVTARHLLRGAGAFSFGSGIWSMHFIGMLAYHMHMKISYDPWLRALSMIIAVAIAYVVLLAVDASRLTAVRLLIGGTLTGFAIAAMHYTGMAAMRMDGDIHYEAGLYALSVVIAVIASMAALIIFFRLGHSDSRHKTWWEIAAAMIMGAAVCGMHYTGMAAAVFVPAGDHQMDANPNLTVLASMIGIVTVVIFAISIMVALYARELSNVASRQQQTFPVEFLVVSMVMTLIAAVWAGGNGFYVNFFLRDEINTSLQLNKLADDIDYYKDDTTLLIRKYLTGNDPAALASYQADVDALDKAIDEAKERSPNPALHEAASNLDSMSDLLEDLNRKSLQLKEQGKLDQANAVMDSDAYVTIARTYAENSMSFTRGVDGMFQSSLEAFMHNVSMGMYFAIFIITILPFTWLFAFRSVRRWRSEMEKTRETLALRETELQRYIGEIEIEKPGPPRRASPPNVRAPPKAIFSPI